MVRVAIVALALTRSVADEDVYHHTQLLQTKVHPQKVAIHADGVKDDVALFQSSFHKKLYQNSRKVALDKFMALLGAKWDSSSGSSWSYLPETFVATADGSSSYGSWSYSNDEMPEYMAEEAKKYYGDDVDLEQFWECAKSPPETASTSWYPDPNVGMKTVTEYMDGCVGRTNSLTAACEGEYGSEVGLFDCMMCGMTCQCDLENECDLGCHRECMAFDEEKWDEEWSYDSSWTSSSSHEEGGECKMFYGEDVDLEQCENCGEKCWEDGIKGMDWEDQSYDKEREFWETFGACSDKCMGISPNQVTAICQQHYGQEVDVFECINCGMVCECNMEGCEGSSEYFACHPTCMKDDWMVWGDTSSWWNSSSWNSSWSTWNSSDSNYSSSYPSSYSSYGSSSYGSYSYWTSSMEPSWKTDWSGSSSYYSSWKLAKANMQKNVKTARDVHKLSKKQTGDELDLMQTTKHLENQPTTLNDGSTGLMQTGKHLENEPTTPGGR